MSFTTRLALIFILMVSIATGLSAQETTESTATAATATAATDSAAATDTAASGETADNVGSEVTRERFGDVLRRYPPEVATILSLDPSLLSDPAFLARYPAIRDFVAAHPEVRHHGQYYLRQFEEARRPRATIASAFMDAIGTAFGISVVVFSVMWLLRTLIEQRRWVRLSRTQAEVHNKILDRFSTSEELLTYIRTPAGTKFLESAPIPLHAERATPNSPTTRVVLSIQLGVVLVAAAIGMLLVSLRLDKEGAEGMFSMGVIAFCIGGGFIASAAVSLLVSRRLGLWQAPGDAPNVPMSNVDDAGLVK